MKLLKSFLGFVACSTLIFSSCQKDVKPCPINSSSSVWFKAVISPETKASNASWDAGDAVGIYMIKGGETLSDATQLSANKKFTTPGDGKFTAAPGSEVELPTDGAVVDFVSYYPYKQEIQNFTYMVNVSDQRSQPAIDLLYSNNAKNVSNVNSGVNTEFKHMLSKVILNISKGSDALTGLKVKITGLNTAAPFNLSTGVLGAATTVADIEMAVKTDGTVAEAIVIPSVAAVNGAKIVFTLGADTYTYELPATTQYDQSKKYSYNVVLKREGVVVVSPVATITNWTDTPSVDVTLDKDNNTPVVPVEGILFKETFGNKDLASNKYTPALYPDYDNKAPIVFGGSNVDIRSTKAFTSHVWFGANKETSFSINGINTTDYTDMKLTFDITANLFNDGSSININILKVKCGDTFLTVPSVVLAKVDGYLNKYYTATISGLPSGFTSLEFSFGLDNTLGFRLSNIIITGKK